MGKLFLDFNFWIQGYRTVQTAHCALLTLLWINYINRLLTLFTLFGILSYCFLFLVFTSLTWKSTLHPHSRSLLCPGSWKDSTLPFMTLWKKKYILFHCVVEQLVNCHVGLLKIVHVPQTISWGAIQFNTIKGK